MKNNAVENKILATVWISLALVLLVLAIYVLVISGIYLIAPVLGMSYILFLMGRQRLASYQISESEFNPYIQKISLAVAISAALGVVAISNV